MTVSPVWIAAAAWLVVSVKVGPVSVVTVEVAVRDGYAHPPSFVRSAGSQEA